MTEMDNPFNKPPELPEYDNSEFKQNDQETDEDLNEFVGDNISDFDSEKSVTKKTQEDAIYKSILLSLVPFPLSWIISSITGIKPYKSLKGIKRFFSLILVVSIFLLFTNSNQPISDNKKDEKKATPPIENPNILQDVDFGQYALNEQQLPADLSGTEACELDLSNLKGEDRVRAQRYQLCLLLSDIFDSDPIFFYASTAVESSADLGTCTDIYQQAVDVKEVENDWHCIGMAQITRTAQRKHEPYAFESVFSTREGSPKDNSVAVISTDGIDDFYTEFMFRREDIPEVTTENIKYRWEFHTTPNTGQEAEWAKNIKFTEQMLAYQNTTLDGCELHYRPSVYYMPDVAYSMYARLGQMRNALDKAAKAFVDGTATEMKIKQIEYGWTLEEAKHYLSLDSVQRAEIAYIYYGDWYIGSYNSNHPPTFKQLHRFGFKAQELNGGSICMKQDLSGKNIWHEIDGTDAPYERVKGSGESLLERCGMTEIHNAMWEATVENTEARLAITYGIRGVNLGYAEMLKDKAIYEGHKIEKPKIPEGGIPTLTGGDVSIGTAGVFKGMKTSFPLGTTSGAKITSGYGYRTLQGNSEFHGAVDIAGVPEGTTIRAFCGGKVIHSAKSDSAGNWVVIQHTFKNDGSDIFTSYMHMADGSITVRTGDTVTEGQAIGKIGNTGRSYGTHLDFSILYGTPQSVLSPSSRKSINPLPYITQSYYEKSGYTMSISSDAIPTIQHNTTVNLPRDKAVELINGITTKAWSMVGKTPYLWDEETEAGADCSGFIYVVYRKGGGLGIPRESTHDMVKYFGKKVENPSEANMQAGDIIMQSGHVMLYVGNGKVLHAPDEGEYVKEKPFSEVKNIVCVRRLINIKD